MNKKQIENFIGIGIGINLLLAIIKLLAGYLGDSISLQTDGYNSLIDFMMSIGVLFTIKLSLKQPDDDHPYGHQKFEGITYFALGMIFLFTSGVIIFDVIRDVYLYQSGQLDFTKPTQLALYVSLIAIAIKVCLSIFYAYLFKKTQHPTLKAEYKNHRLDVLATLAAVIGIFLARFGYLIFDYIFALAIAGIMIKLAFSTIKEAITFIVDQAPEQTIIDDVYAYILSLEGVEAIDELKIRMHVTQLYVDVEIAVNRHLSLEKAHDIAENVHMSIESKYLEVIHCMVHVNPLEA